MTNLYPVCAIIATTDGSFLNRGVSTLIPSSRLLFRPDRRRNLIHSPLHRRIRARLDDVRQHAANDTWVRLAFANAVLADGSLSI